MGEETRIGGIAVGFMQGAGPEVFSPAEVVFSVSSDGVGFTELKRVARCVRVRAKAGKKYGDWIFTYEIVVFPPDSRD